MISQHYFHFRAGSEAGLDREPHDRRRPFSQKQAARGRPITLVGDVLTVDTHRELLAPEIGGVRRAKIVRWTIVPTAEGNHCNVTFTMPLCSCERLMRRVVTLRTRRA